uniref:Uncharacterized protein n=1 Tax=Knipowitschia caucasica TaxID=637954 RepID=A0AAV2J358_KNICA
MKRLAVRYPSPPGHAPSGSPLKKNTRLPGPSSRAPAAGSGAPRSPSNLNRRSLSFSSIDKSKPLQFASGNEREDQALQKVVKTAGKIGTQLPDRTGQEYVP